MLEIAIWNQSTVVSDAEVESCTAALQIQMDRDFAPIWGLHSKLVFVSKSGTPDPTHWQLVILDDSTVAGALGFHEMTNAGLPIGFVFAKTDIEDGASWTVTASHELCELRCDPRISEAVENDNPDGSIRFFAFETADACEDDQFGYEITTPDGKAILVSDFVTPSWFDAVDPTTGPYDFRGHIKKPLEILPNGYIGVLDVKHGQWTQLFDKFDSPQKEARSVPHPGSRRQRRAMGRSNWRKSTAGA